MDMTTSLENEWLCAQLLTAYGIAIASGGNCGIDVPRFRRLLSKIGRSRVRSFALRRSICPDVFAALCGISDRIDEARFLRLASSASVPPTTAVGVFDASDFDD
jgi:hypothetical protein